MGNIKLNMNGNYMENDKIDLLSNQKKEKDLSILILLDMARSVINSSD